MRWQVSALQPYFFVYCQNPELSEEKVHEMLQPVLRNGERGRVVKLDNIGREGASSFTKSKRCCTTGPQPATVSN